MNRVIPSLPGPKAESVTAEGTADGFVIQPGWSSEATPAGETRIVVSAPTERVPRVHAALIAALRAPLSFLYRQEVDRCNPRPQGSPPKDFVALDLGHQRVIDALTEAAPLVYGDARCEIWIRGAMHEQLVLDHDGILYCYPDDPMFRDALASSEVPAVDVETLAERDYVKHWFRPEADALEKRLIEQLRLTEVAQRR